MSPAIPSGCSSGTPSYPQHVENYVFAPAGVSGPTLDHPGVDALAHNFPVSGSGWNPGDLTSMRGGADWHMSPDDLLRIMRTFRRHGVIMSATRARALLDNGFGIDSAGSTPLGPAYTKRGFWQDSGKHVEQSLVYFLPRDMELVVLVNSPIASTGEVFELLVDKALMSNISLTASLLRRP